MPDKALGVQGGNFRCQQWLSLMSVAIFLMSLPPHRLDIPMGSMDTLTDWEDLQLKL